MLEKFSRIYYQNHFLDVYGSEEEPYFLAVEVARLIDYSAGNTDQMIDTLYPEDKILVPYIIRNQRGGNRKPVWFLTEDGLYEVLMQSRKPIAREFKRFVKDTLKQMRREGGYTQEGWWEYIEDQSAELGHLYTKHEKIGLSEEEFDRMNELEEEFRELNRNLIRDDR